MGTVLIVDDEEAIIGTMEVNLRARGYRVEIATTGKLRRWPRATTRTRSCWISGCRTSTASTLFVASVAGARCRSSSCLLEAARPRR
jgi:CheY-like chemotaxis protein